MKVYNGGTFANGYKGADGDVYINAVIYATATFGKGTTFINPTFLRCCPKHYNNPPSQVGDGSTAIGGSYQRVAFGKDSTVSGGVYKDGFSNQGLTDGSSNAYGKDTRGHTFSATAADGQAVTATEHLHINNTAQREPHYNSATGYTVLTPSDERITVSGNAKPCGCSG